jgi:hypothetical protein
LKFKKRGRDVCSFSEAWARTSDVRMLSASSSKQKSKSLEKSLDFLSIFGLFLTGELNNTKKQYLGALFHSICNLPENETI